MAVPPQSSWRSLFSRPWFAWSVLFICLAAASSAVGWLTVAAWKSDQTRLRALRDSEIRNALWRLDSLAAPLVAIESNRPSLSASFSASPVLNPALVKGYIVRDVNGCWTLRREARSPEADSLPEDSVFCRQNWDLLLDSLPPAAEASSPDAVEPVAVDYFEGLIDWPVNSTNYALNPVNNDAPQRMANSRRGADSQELSDRNKVFQQMRQVANSISNDEGKAKAELKPLRPIWVEGELVLARQIFGGKLADTCRLEICWLNWPEWERLLLKQVDESAQPFRLVAAPTVSGVASAVSADDRRMASLPIQLEWAVPTPPVTWPLPFIGIWALLVVVGGAFLLLMRQTLALSERRAAFVSAVTHELRTPLTTFRLYSEMLSDGVASDPEQQQSYFETLTREANRLTHLVENVLAYARLEHGRPTARNETLSAGQLIDRCWPRLEQRVAETNLKLSLEISADASDCLLTTNALAIEQILFNLIDNSCKYARESTDPRIICRVARRPHELVVEVADFGPGLSRSAEKTIFHPFRKSSAQAAESAPGIGLGLSLCRRLVGELNGSIRHNRNSPTGLRIEMCFPAT